MHNGESDRFSVEFFASSSKSIILEENIDTVKRKVITLKRLICTGNYFPSPYVDIFCTFKSKLELNFR